MSNKTIKIKKKKKKTVNAEIKPGVGSIAGASPLYTKATVTLPSPGQRI
jgi:hypothetical protein